MVGRSAPFEEDRFGRRQDRTGILEAPEGDVVIDPVPRGDRIDGDEHRQPSGEEIEDGLANTDVGLEATDHDRADAAPRRCGRSEPGAAGRAERPLLLRRRKEREEGRGGGPQPLRVLLGEVATDPEDLCRFGQPGDTGHEPLGGGHDSQEPLLDVDHTDNRCGGEKTHRGLLG